MLESLSGEGNSGRPMEGANGSKSKSVSHGETPPYVALLVFDDRLENLDLLGRHGRVKLGSHANEKPFDPRLSGDDLFIRQIQRRSREGSVIRDKTLD
jgi:hypothetical protein